MPPRPMTQLQRRLAEMVRLALDEKRMTQAELASKVAVGEKHLSQMLNGSAQGSFAMWDKILAELEIML